MSRNQLISGIAVLAAAALMVWAWNSSDMKLSWGGQSGTESVLSYEINAEGDRVHTRSSEFYDITATYPNTTPLASSADAGADAAAVLSMESWVRDAIEKFLTDGNFDNLTEADKQVIGFNAGRKYTLTISYKSAQSPRTASYIFTVSTDTLGAHPNSVFKTFRFDTQTGQELTVGSLFTDGSWIALVSAMSKAMVTAKMVSMGGEGEVVLFDEGFDPTEENFRNTYLEGDDLVILFDPYQVAAYAAGPQEVRVKRSMLQEGTFKPEYQ